MRQTGITWPRMGVFDKCLLIVLDCVTLPADSDFLCHRDDAGFHGFESTRVMNHTVDIRGIVISSRVIDI